MYCPGTVTMGADRLRVSDGADQQGYNGFPFRRNQTQSKFHLDGYGIHRIRYHFPATHIFLPRPRPARSPGKIQHINRIRLPGTMSHMLTSYHPMLPAIFCYMVTCIFVENQVPFATLFSIEVCFCLWPQSIFVRSISIMSHIHEANTKKRRIKHEIVIVFC